MKGHGKPTLKAFGTDIIHAPANQSHKQSQEHQKDPVFSQFSSHHMSQAMDTAWEERRAKDSYPVTTLGSD